jgi:hypothetical protein
VQYKYNNYNAYLVLRLSNHFVADDDFVDDRASSRRTSFASTFGP